MRPSLVKFAPWGIACLTALAILVGYAPALSGGLFYDDLANLSVLGTLDDSNAALHFVFGGDAGPLGRPLALASFLPHAEGWPDNSTQILLLNVILHILNAGLLCLLGYWLLGLRGITDPVRRVYIALSAAGLWAVMPLLASTSLIAVQRMTGLSTFFGLLGLLAFVRGFYWLSGHPRRALFLQAGGLALGTSLAALSKENGLLIPVFALVIEGVLLRSLPAAAIFGRLRRGALWMALFVLVALLLKSVTGSLGAADFRGFTLGERLLTEAGRL